MKILIGWNYKRESFLTKENLELLESLGEVSYLADKESKRVDPDVLREALVDVDVLVCGWQDPHNKWLTESLWDQRIGIVGYGATSRYLINMLKLFHARIKLYSRHMTDEQAAALGVQKASLEEIFSTCRVISLNTAKSPENHHLVNDELLSLMEQDALLVNTARGDLIDEEALAKHLLSGHIRAALDVYAKEPLQKESPLWTVPASRLHMIPHMAGPTPDQRPACARLVIEDIARFQKGEPLQNEIAASRATTMTH